MTARHIFARLFVPVFAIASFCSCATTPNQTADIGGLTLGKTTPVECRVKYGEPKEKFDQNGPEGKVEIFRYSQIADRGTKVFGSVLQLEFKDGVLNGFNTGSSFPNKRTTFAVTNLVKIEWAASTKDEVRELLGPPHGILRCPTQLFNGAAHCKLTGREIWVYEDLHPVAVLAPPRIKRLFSGSLCLITFDEHNIVMDIADVQSDNL